MKIAFKPFRVGIVGAGPACATLGGGLTNHPYSRNLLRFMTRIGIYGHDPADFAVV